MRSRTRGWRISATQNTPGATPFATLKSTTPFLVSRPPSAFGQK